MMYTFTHGSRALRDAEAEEDARRIRRIESESQTAFTRKMSEKDQKQINDILEQRAENDQKYQDQQRKDQEEHRLKMGDYFMATCWRLHFFLYSMLFAAFGSLTLNVDVAVTGLFWQLVMRYNVLGALMWTFVYSMLSFFVAV